MRLKPSKVTLPRPAGFIPAITYGVFRADKKGFRRALSRDNGFEFRTKGLSALCARI
jgi:hypothetical protein